MKKSLVALPLRFAETSAGLESNERNFLSLIRCEVLRTWEVHFWPEKKCRVRTFGHSVCRLTKNVRLYEPAPFQDSSTAISAPTPCTRRRGGETFPSRLRYF